MAATKNQEGQFSSLEICKIMKQTFKIEICVNQLLRINLNDRILSCFKNRFTHLYFRHPEKNSGHAHAIVF